MSLQVWLPLNGSLENKGLANVTVTNNGAALDNNGKIGKCYSFNGNSSYISIDNLSIGNNWGYGCWFKSAASSRTWEGLIIYNLNGGDADMQLGFYTYPGGSKIQSSANGQYNASISHTYDNQWHHLFATFNGSELKTYKDGVLINTTTITNGLLTRSKLTIGARCRGASYDVFFLGSVNDFRLYDHCLSDKEVKEIAKGLVLHYKLDGSCGGNDNLVLESNIPNRNASATAYLAGIYPLQNKLTSGKTYTYSVNVTPTLDKKGLGVWFGGGSYSAGMVSDSTGLKAKTYSYTFTANDNIAAQGTAHIYVSNNTGTQGSTPVTGSAIVNWIKIEEGDRATPWTPNPADLGIDTTKVVDCSGNGYDGTINGSLTTSSDSARYLGSTVFDGNTASITLGNLSTICPEGNFTFNCWIYKDGTWSTKTWETILGGPGGFELECKLAGNNSPYIHPYSWGGGSTSTPNTYSIAYDLNKWNMITMTRTSSGSKFYLNGELKVNGTAGSIPSGNYFIGAWSNSAAQNYKGKVSDVRIYNTILSESDIKELYETSASIDKNGNLYCRELVEV